jgi:Ca2+/Na+ antiporter
MLLLIGGTVLLVLFMFLGKRKNRVDRWEGALLMGIFITYTAFLIQQEL